MVGHMGVGVFVLGRRARCRHGKDGFGLGALWGFRFGLLSATVPDIMNVAVQLVS